jgi:hypothetical protein
MAKNTPTPKHTSGGGLQFENEAVAYFLAHLISRSKPLNPPDSLVHDANNITLKGDSLRKNLSKSLLLH